MPSTRAPLEVHAVTGIPSPPPYKPKGVFSDALYDQLALMNVNDCVDVDRAFDKVRGIVYRYRKVNDRSKQFIIRAMNEKWTRIWRTR